MHLAYIRTRQPKVKEKKVLWMGLKYAKRLADNQAEFLEANGISKEEWIKRILDNVK